MSMTLAELRAAFQNGNAGGPAGQWYRDNGYAARDWAGLCQGVANWCTWFTTGAEPAWYDSATDGWYASPAAVSGDPYTAPLGALHWFAIPGVRDGHVQVALGGGQILHAHPLVQDPWGTSIGTADWSWFKDQRPWYEYLGWTYNNGSNIIDLVQPAPEPPAPTPGPSQRQVGDVAARRRIAPNRDADPVGLWDPFTIIDMVSFVTNGETVENSSVWYWDAAGTWSWSGAYTEIHGHNLTDITPAPTPDPVPVPDIPPPAPDVPPTPDPVPIPDPDVPPTPDPVPLRPAVGLIGAIVAILATIVVGLVTWFIG